MRPSFSISRTILQLVDESCRCLEQRSKPGSIATTRRTMSNIKLIDEDTPIIPLDEVRRFIRECMEAVSTPREHAQALADLLAEADYRGHYSHGMNRLDIYIDDVKDGACDGAAIPVVLKETPATAWVDGRNGLGAVVGNYCMDLAIKKAKEVGIGCVVCKGSNHYGIAGMYSMQAQKQGLIGFSSTNTSPFMAPTRAKQACLGTNPITMAVPPAGDDGVVLDMATTAVAVGKIEIQRRKNKPIPSGWAIDKQGKVTTDPFSTEALMPLGGAEMNSGYKGYGLGLMVETLCGILGGAAYGPNIRKWGDTSKIANLGQLFMALDPKCFAPGFEERMVDITKYLRGMEPAEEDKAVMVPGDPERMHMKAVDEAGGVRYVKNQMETCAQLAKEYGVQPLRPVSRR